MLDGPVVLVTWAASTGIRTWKYLTRPARLVHVCARISVQHSGVSDVLRHAWFSRQWVAIFLWLFITNPQRSMEQRNATMGGFNPAMGGAYGGGVRRSDQVTALWSLYRAVMVLR